MLAVALGLGLPQPITPSFDAVNWLFGISTIHAEPCEGTESDRYRNVLDPIVDVLLPGNTRAGSDPILDKKKLLGFPEIVNVPFVVALSLRVFRVVPDNVYDDVSAISNHETSPCIKLSGVDGIITCSPEGLNCLYGCPVGNCPTIPHFQARYPSII